MILVAVILRGGGDDAVISDRVDSLNVSVSAGIILHHVLSSREV